MSRPLAAALLLLSSSALAGGSGASVRRCDQRGLDLDGATLGEAQRLFREGKPRDAQCLLEVVTRRESSNPQAWYWLAVSATEVGRTGRAALAASRAIELDPQHGESRVLAGFVAQTRGEFAEARTHYQLFLDEHPNTPEAAEVQSVIEQLPAAQAFARR